MAFYNSPKKVDLGVTMIENMFLNNYMVSANGTHVKVYLLAYSLSQDHETSENLSNTRLARLLSLTLEDVHSAWDYWESRGIVKKHIGDDLVNYDVEFLSIRQLYLDSLTGGAFYKRTEMTRDDLIKNSTRHKNLQMMNTCEMIISKKLAPNEQKRIFEVMDETGASDEVVIKAFEYACKVRGIRDVKYVVNLVNMWSSKGLRTPKEITEHFSREEQMGGVFKNFYRVLGFAGRNVAEGDREKMKAWIGELSLSEDFITEVLKEYSSRTSNPNINFMDSIIRKLHSNGITTVEALSAHLRSESAAKQGKDTQSGAKNDNASSSKQQPQKAQTRNKFNNFEANKRKYTNEELENMLLSKKGLVK